MILDILKIFLEKITKYFWQAIFFTVLTLVFLAHSKSNFFNYVLFETKSGTAQASIIFILILSGYQLLFSFFSMIINSIRVRLYEIYKFEEEQNKTYQQMNQLLEDLFNVQKQIKFIGTLDANLLKLYLITIYKRNIEKFRANDIFDIFQKDAEERQKEEKRKNVYWGPRISKQECINIQNFLQRYNFIYFDGESYEVNKILFNKLKELENREMLSISAETSSYLNSIL